MLNITSCNESAITLKWLMHKLGLLSNDQPGIVLREWSRIRDQMFELNSKGLSVVETKWISDFWLARTSDQSTGMLFPVWVPPVKFDDWPTQEVNVLIKVKPWNLKVTNYQSLQNEITQAVSLEVSDNVEAMSRFNLIKSETTRHGDSKMIQLEHIRAWLVTSVGRLLMGLVLTPSGQSELLINETLNRLAIPGTVTLPGPEIPQELNLSLDEHHLYGKRLELLYNMSINDEGSSSSRNIRVGQGERWREHWAWLSQEIAPGDIVGAVQLTASLMRCPPLVEGLLQALESKDPGIQTMALAVIRRWVLTLKAMTWLEFSIKQTWKFIQPQDLACFAFNSLKPGWPRPVLAISHRSGDAKAMLIKMKLWNWSRCAIDANYVPSWETNRGMMWGLFAATPVIARIHSLNYYESAWCKREYEMIEYLIEKCDFIQERCVLDIALSGLYDLDLLPMSWDEKEDQVQDPVSGKYPPLSTVLTPGAMPGWEVKMFAAAGALRVMNAFISDPTYTNSLASDPTLTNSLSSFHGAIEFIPTPAPTNNPGGWKDYALILEDIQSLFDASSQVMPVQLPGNYDHNQRLLDIELINRIPNLSNGSPALTDILVALEWLRTEWPLIDKKYWGDFIMIDCRNIDNENWETNLELSLLRGLANILTPVPVWFIQLQGQDVDTWRLVGDRPIFTEYFPNQFSWMLHGGFSLDRRIMQTRYPANSGLNLSEELRNLCMTGYLSK
ncbi:MAG: hypothetical protein ABI863_11580 [Ginsengibacter sp.]